MFGEKSYQKFLSKKALSNTMELMYTKDAKIKSKHVQTKIRFHLP